MRNHGLRGDHVRLERQTVEAVPGVGRSLHDGRACVRAAHVVDEDVYPAEVVDDLLHGALHRRAVRGVGHHCERPAAHAGHLVGNRLRRVRVDLDDGDVGALFRHAEHDAPADSLPAPGDYGYLVFQLHRYTPLAQTRKDGPIIAPL